MGVKQREWGIYTRPYSTTIVDGVKVKNFYDMPNKDIYIGDRAPIENKLHYSCRGNSGHFKYYLPKFYKGLETKEFRYSCLDSYGNCYTETVSYQHPIFDPIETLEVEGDMEDDGVWSLYYKTTSYTYLMEKIEKMCKEDGWKTEAIKVVELFDIDIETLALTWDGGGKED